MVLVNNNDQFFLTKKCWRENILFIEILHPCTIWMQSIRKNEDFQEVPGHAVDRAKGEGHQGCDEGGKSGAAGGGGKEGDGGRGGDRGDLGWRGANRANRAGRQRGRGRRKNP